MSTCLFPSALSTWVVVGIVIVDAGTFSTLSPVPLLPLCVRYCFFEGEEEVIWALLVVARGDVGKWPCFCGRFVSASNTRF